MTLFPGSNSQLGSKILKSELFSKKLHSLKAANFSYEKQLNHSDIYTYAEIQKIDSKLSTSFIKCISKVVNQ